MSTVVGMMRMSAVKRINNIVSILWVLSLVFCVGIFRQEQFGIDINPIFELGSIVLFLALSLYLGVVKIRKKYTQR